jgi:hypothetical protein
MWRWAILLFSVTSGCANYGLEATALNTPTETGSIVPKTDLADAARGNLRSAQHRAFDEVRRPMRLFLAEKERNCNSPRLREARFRATETASGMAAAMKPAYGVMLEAGSAVLDVADAAKTKGCNTDATELYQFVLKNYVGLGYAALRDRATTGIRGLREKS